MFMLNISPPYAVFLCSMITNYNLIMKNPLCVSEKKDIMKRNPFIFLYILTAQMNTVKSKLGGETCYEINC